MFIPPFDSRIEPYLTAPRLSRPCRFLAPDNLTGNRFLQFGLKRLIPEQFRQIFRNSLSVYSSGYHAQKPQDRWAGTVRSFNGKLAK